MVGQRGVNIDFRHGQSTISHTNKGELSNMKKLKVNADSCIGCGLCVNMAPDAFALNDEGKSEAIAEMTKSSPAAQSLLSRNNF